MDTRHPIRHLSRPWSSTGSAPRLAAAALVSVILMVLVASSLPWSSGTASAHLGTSRWELHDRAVYVVSTMNLVHCRDGRVLSTILIHQDLVTRYDLYADKQVDNLYFIAPRRDDGSSVGVLAYQIGWVAPMSVSSSLDPLQVGHAPTSAYAAYRHDPKHLVGSFTATVPS